MPIITISRQLGSFGNDIAEQLSKQLECSCLDKKSLEAAFGEFGLSKDSLERYDEKKPGFWDLFKTDKARYLHYIKGAIYEFAGKGSCVILGRGGQSLLAELPGVIHLRIVAPTKVRLERVMKRYECDEPHGLKIIHHSDHERAGYHKFFFDENWESLALYDMVLNTGSFSVDTVLGLVHNIIGTGEFKERQKETQRILADFFLEHRIKTAVLYEEKVSVQFLEVEARNGVVTIGGIVGDNDDEVRCEKIAAAVEGVKEVKNEVYFKPLATNYGIHY
ncbi:MAG: BON domain-containing protein [bacterium]|nr:BON domain-containing protein [bacterium]